jgi:hypothetical protein
VVRIDGFCAVCASFGFPEVAGPAVLGLGCLGEGEGIEGSCVELFYVFKKVCLNLNDSVALDDAVLVDALNILHKYTHVVFFQ